MAGSLRARIRGLNAAVPPFGGHPGPAPHRPQGFCRTCFSMKLTKKTPNTTQKKHTLHKRGFSAGFFTELAYFKDEPAAKRAWERDIPPPAAAGSLSAREERAVLGDSARALGDRAVPGSRPSTSPERRDPTPLPPAHLHRAQPPARGPRRPAPAALLAGHDRRACCHWAARSCSRLFIG